MNPDLRVAALALMLHSLALLTTTAAFESPKPTGGAREGRPDATRPKPESTQPATKVAKLNESGTVIADFSNKRLLLKTKVVLREGTLEMLCCLKQTKEHESILALDAKASVVHAGLVALGAKSGKPVQFQPEIQPPTGQTIEIFLQWTDEMHKPHRVPAQTWVRQATHRFYVAELAQLPPEVKLPQDSVLRYSEKLKELTWYGPMSEEQQNEWLAMTRDAKFQSAIKTFYKQSQPRQMNAAFVFAGSGFFTDEATGEKFYMADSGDLICVANFPTATIDVAVESSATGTENLLFEAYSDRIPSVGTEVIVELVPVSGGTKKTEKPPTAESPK